MRAAAARSIGWLAGIALAAAAASVAQAAGTWSLLPQPLEMRPSDGEPLSIANAASIEIRGAPRAQIAGIVERFAARVAATRGLQLQLAPAGDAHAAIVFELNPRADIGGDAGYRIDIDRAAMHLAARSAQGLFYASVTAWQLLTQPGWRRGAPAELAPGTIVDRPRFAWRALLLDSGRHFQSVDEIKQLIGWMALNKLNVLVWHLTEDQGWRIEIKKYPRLTSVGAWRTPDEAGLKDIDPATGKPRPYGGFYSQDQIRDIVAYAKDRNITIIPEIEMPGHATAAIAAYPELGSGEAPKGVETGWGVYPQLYNVDDSTFAFLEDVLTEVITLFPGSYIHIGGDEAIKDQWKASPKIQAQIRALHVADEKALQGYFTARIEK